MNHLQKILILFIALISSLSLNSATPMEISIPAVEIPDMIVKDYSAVRNSGIDIDFQNCQEINFNYSFDTLLIARFDSIKNTIPSYMTYNGKWDNNNLNTFRVNLDSLLDSVLIDCSTFVYPTKSNRKTSNFGVRWSRFHYGIDLGLRVGDTIRSTFAGKVRFVSYERRGYGRYIVVRHANGLETLYAHLHRTFVKENQTIEAGEAIALGGNTGRSTGPHLHFEFRYQGNPFNPEKIINLENKSVYNINENGEYLLTTNDTFSHKKTLAKLKQAQYCRVRSGDTLSHIARRYGTSVSRLCSLNRIRSTSILQIGQRIRYR